MCNNHYNFFLNYFSLYTLIHLQNSISQYNEKLSNLQAVQEKDMAEYLHLKDETLIILKNFILKLQEEEKITTSKTLKV